MFTVCPKCTLTLVVTTVDLRAGQGYVRCGRCANVFNALIALREGEPGGNTADTANRRLQETAPRPPAEPALGSGVEMDADTEPEPEPEPEPESAQDPQAEEPSLEFDAISTDVSEIFISPAEAEHDTASGSYETVVLGEEAPSEPETAVEPLADELEHTDTIAADEWSLLDDEPVADDESVIEEAPKASDPPWVEQMFAEAEAQGTPEPEAAFAAPEAQEELIEQVARISTGAAPPSDTALEPLLNPPVDSRPRWQYISGIVVLALLLLIQVVHFNRQNLLLSNSVGPLIATVYGWFDATPAPRWDLMAYDVKLISAEAQPGGNSRLRVRLSVQNSSDRVQPLPLLRLTLQDRYANPVATRDLEPAEYLPESASRRRLLEPNQRIDTEVQVVDPGSAAIGYEIDACLHGEGGTVGCANDARRRAATSG